VDDEMPVSLTLKRRGAYTNLDYVEGNVHLDISSSETIENVTVKIEGTALASMQIYNRYCEDYHLRKETGS